MYMEYSQQNFRQKSGEIGESGSTYLVEKIQRGSNQEGIASQIIPIANSNQIEEQKAPLTFFHINSQMTSSRAFEQSTPAINQPSSGYFVGGSGDTALENERLTP